MKGQGYAKAVAAALMGLWLSSQSLCAVDEELALYRIALERAESLGNRDSLAAACCNLSEYYTYRDEDSTRYFCLRGLEYADRNKPEPYLFLKNTLAYTYTAEGDMQTALQMYREVLEECRRLDYSDNGFRSSVLSSQGVAFRRMEMPDSALACYGKALELLGKDGPADEKAYLLTNIAILYANTSRQEEAEKYARLSVSAALDCEDEDMTIYAATTAGAIFGISGKTDEASSAIHSVLLRARSRKLPVLELKGITYLLSVFGRTGSMDSIYFYRAAAEKLVADLPAESAEVQGYRETMANIFHSMGRHKESLELWKHLEKVSETNSQTPSDVLSLMMARDYKALGQTEKASEYYERAYRLADSLHAADLQTSLSEFSVKYETAEKELEISRLNEVQSLQKARTLKWTVIAIAALSALAVFALSYFYRLRKRKKEEELKVAKGYIEGLEQERSRLAKDLHDGVCNDLLGIGLQLKSLPQNEDLDRICSILEQTRDEVRGISHELIPPKFQNVTLKETVEAYVERFRRSSDISLECLCENKGIEWASLPAHISYEVYRVMQELLSNIVKHSGATWIRIGIFLEPSRVVLKISDNGRHSDVQGRGIGSDTVRERTTAVGGRFTAGSDETGQSFTFEVPLISK